MMRGADDHGSIPISRGADAHGYGLLSSRNDYERMPPIPSRPGHGYSSPPSLAYKVFIATSCEENGGGQGGEVGSVFRSLLVSSSHPCMPLTISSPRAASLPCLLKSQCYSLTRRSSSSHRPCASLSLSLSCSCSSCTSRRRVLLRELRKLRLLRLVLLDQLLQ